MAAAADRQSLPAALTVAEPAVAVAVAEPELAAELGPAELERPAAVAFVSVWQPADSSSSLASASARFGPRSGRLHYISVHFGAAC